MQPTSPPSEGFMSIETRDLRDLYLHMLEAAVRNTLYPREILPPTEADVAWVKSLLERAGEVVGRERVEQLQLDPAALYLTLRLNDPHAHTLADAAQIANVRFAVESVLADGVPGDLIEAGVFRGGQTIYMRGVLKAYGVTDRRVFVADSFQGLPAPDPTQHPIDALAYELLGGIGRFCVSEEAVRENFARYGLLDDQVCFLKGWFHETLPHAPIERLAVIRLDGDWYESTWTALDALYPKLSPGGFAIIDDYGTPVGCRAAVDAYREKHGITAPLVPVNRQTVYWRRAD